MYVDIHWLWYVPIVLAISCYIIRPGHIYRVSNNYYNLFTLEILCDIADITAQSEINGV